MAPKIILSPKYTFRKSLTYQLHKNIIFQQSQIKRSRSRSEKRKRKDKSKKSKDKKRKDKHSKRSSKRHSSSRSSSDSRSSRSNSAGEDAAKQIKIIPITTNLPPINKADNSSSTPTANAIPSSILSFVNKAQQNVGGTVGSSANPLREKKKNAFSSPPKNTNGFSNPVTAPGAGGLEIPGMGGGLNITSSQATPGLLDISLGGLNSFQHFGMATDTQIIGNKIPPALQKQYIHALRIYIGNIPDPVDVEDVCNFVYQQMANAGGLVEQGNPILSKKHDPAKKFIFLQLRSIEETTACMELDGVIYRGKSLRFRRPKDYGTCQKVEGTRPVPVMDRSKLKIVQTQVENTYNKLQIMNLPETFSEEHVMQLLTTYGDLKSFHLAVDKITSESKGFAFCEFHTDRSTVECLNKLSGQSIINKVLNVKRCNPNLAPPSEEPILSLEQLSKNLVENVNKTVIDSGQKDIQEDYLKKMLTINVPKYEGLIQDDATNILKLHNVVNKQLIEEDPEYELVYNDLKQQLNRLGKVISIVIPRKKEKFKEGIGYVYVEFDNERTSQIASYLLQKLKYDGKAVKAEFYSPLYYADKTFF